MLEGVTIWCEHDQSDHVVIVDLLWHKFIGWVKGIERVCVRELVRGWVRVCVRGCDDLMCVCITIAWSILYIVLMM